MKFRRINNTDSPPSSFTPNLKREVNRRLTIISLDFENSRDTFLFTSHGLTPRKKKNLNQPKRDNMKIRFGIWTIIAIFACYILYGFAVPVIGPIPAIVVAGLGFFGLNSLNR